MDRVIISGKKLKELRAMYEDCLNLNKKNDLTEWGKAEMYVLKKIFDK